MEVTIPIKSWKGFIVVLGIVALAFSIHYYTYYYNPNLDKTIRALKTNDPKIISEALLATSNLGMAKGHKLIPYILPLLSDKRAVPEEIRKKMTKHIQVPAMIKGKLKNAYTIGFAAALTIQALVIIDVHHLRWIGGKAEDEIVSYVIRKINPNDQYTLGNALIAVAQIHRKELLPFWFKCLAVESESIKISALGGFYFYIHDRTNGLWTWKPNQEISQKMAKNLQACLKDKSPFVRQEAKDIIGKLEKAGFVFRKK